MYRVTLIEGQWYVVHIESGAKMPWPITEYMSTGEYCTVYFLSMYDWSSKKRKRWFNKRRKAYLNRNGSMPLTLFDTNKDYYYEEVNSLDCTPTIAYGSKSVKKEAEMANVTVNTQSTVDQFKDQRRYLKDRMSEVYYSKIDDFRKKFKMDPIPAPKTLKELLQHIKDDNYSVNDKVLEAKCYDSIQMFYNVRWTKEKADEAGYAKACDALEKVYKSVQDTINILSPEEGLKALREFEAQSFV